MDVCDISQLPLTPPQGNIGDGYLRLTSYQLYIEKDSLNQILDPIQEQEIQTKVEDIVADMASFHNIQTILDITDVEKTSKADYQFCQQERAIKENEVSHESLSTLPK